MIPDMAGRMARPWGGRPAMPPAAKSRKPETLVEDNTGPPVVADNGPVISIAPMVSPLLIQAPLLPILHPPIMMASEPPQAPEWQPPGAAGDWDAEPGGAVDGLAREPEPPAALAVLEAAPMPVAAAWKAGWAGRPAPATQRVYARTAGAAGAAVARGGADEEETVLWAAGVVADARGEASVSFAVGGAAAAYRVVVEAHARGDPAAAGPAAAPAYGASDSVPLVARLEVQVLQ
jgi:hypothetical protein